MQHLHYIFHCPWNPHAYNYRAEGAFRGSAEIEGEPRFIHVTLSSRLFGPLGKNLRHTIRKQTAFLDILSAELSEIYGVLARQIPLARRTSAPTPWTSCRILGPRMGQI